MTSFNELERGAPREPSFTCSEIDRVISLLQDMVGRHGTLEELRDANATLRESAAYWRDACETLVERVTELEREVGELQDECCRLTSEIGEHERGEKAA